VPGHRAASGHHSDADLELAQSFSREANRRSQARTNSLPAPRARPRIDAMLTTGARDRRTRTSIQAGSPVGPMPIAGWTPASTPHSASGAHRDGDRGNCRARQDRTAGNLGSRYANAPPTAFTCSPRRRQMPGWLASDKRIWRSAATFHQRVNGRMAFGESVQQTECELTETASGGVARHGTGCAAGVNGDCTVDPATLWRKWPRGDVQSFRADESEMAASSDSRQGVGHHQFDEWQGWG
jgi:hypothetical protein